MPVLVIPMRTRGVPINPQFREAGAFVGTLSMSTYSDPVLNRYVKKVDLTKRGIGGLAEKLLPSLCDVTLVTLSESALMLTGFERLPVDDGRHADYAQSWWIQLRS